MTLLACSSRISSTDVDRLDITIAGQHPIGVVFAPSSPLFKMVKKAMREADELERQANDLFGSYLLSGSRPEDLLAEAESLRAATWAHYEPVYVAEMRVCAGLAESRWGPLERQAADRGVVARRDVWQEVRARPRVVFCCYEKNEPGKVLRCHRRLLRVIFVKLGAVDGGEFA